jgi:hypothetical protein
VYGHSVLNSFFSKHHLRPDELYGFVLWFWRYKIFKLMKEKNTSDISEFVEYGELRRSLRFFWEYRRWVEKHKELIASVGTEEAIRKVLEDGEE